MPTIKTQFSFKTEDIDRLNEVISRCGKKSERIINDYLHNVAGEKITRSITNSKFFPRSKRNKIHAQDTKWYEQTNFNLAVGIENNTSGKKSAYYLYYVATGTGTSAKKGPNDFMLDGLDKEYNNVVNGIIEKLLENVDKEMN